LLKNTIEAHPDFTHLTEALDTINKVVDIVNERRRFVENQQKMFATLQKLEFSDVSVHAEKKYSFPHILFRS